MFVKNFLFAKCPKLMELSTFDTKDLVLLLARMVMHKIDGFFICRYFKAGKRSKWVTNKKIMDKRGRIKVTGYTNEDIDKSLIGVCLEGMRVESQELEESKSSSIKEREDSFKNYEQDTMSKEFTPDKDMESM